ncbi:MAG: ABC transporter permease [Muribaculaceae bacterium]|nr:ABC transporter permease [Muribaculaceae bacterium]
MKTSYNSNFRTIMYRTVLQIVRRPVCWIGFLFLPLFITLFLTSLMEQGLPMKIPAAIVDKDGTAISRQVSQTLGSMQLVDLKESSESFTQARHLVQEGKIYGFFMIPENFQADLLAGRGPVITFYTNMTYYVPGSLLFKTFKATALYSKAGIAVRILQDTGAETLVANPTPLLQPVSVSFRPLGNPWLNYSIYLCNSFIPCTLQLMIMLMTCYTLGEEIKHGRSRELLHLGGESILRVLAGKLLPQTLIWIVIAIFMEAWLFKFNHFPMHGSWLWLTLSEIMMVLACQGFAVFIFGLLPNLRLSLSVCALTGILSFSIAAFSFPEQSMYGAVSIFSWLMPTRYNFLIYIDQALNGRDLYYSRFWYVAYIIYMLLPLAVLWKIKRAYRREVYVP